MWIFSSRQKENRKKFDTQPSPRGDFVAMATPLPVFTLKHLCRALMTDACREGGGMARFFFFFLTASEQKPCEVVQHGP